MRAAFSMGSHAQYPPQPNALYAHMLPVKIPNPKKSHPLRVHFLSINFSQLSLIPGPIHKPNESSTTIDE